MQRIQKSFIEKHILKNMFEKMKLKLKNKQQLDRNESINQTYKHRIRPATNIG